MNPVIKTFSPQLFFGAKAYAPIIGLEEKAIVVLFNWLSCLFFWGANVYIPNNRYRGKGKCRPFHWLSCNTAQYTVCMFRWPRPLSIWLLYFALIEQGRGLWAQFMPAEEVHFHRWANLLKYLQKSNFRAHIPHPCSITVNYSKNYWPPHTDESQGKRRHWPFPLLFIAPYLL